MKKHFVEEDSKKKADGIEFTIEASLKDDEEKTAEKLSQT